MTNQAAGLTGYGAPARFFHWLTVGLIIIVVALGSQLEHPPQGWGDTLYRLHWSFGMTILFVTAARLAWRLVHGAPEDYAGLTAFERIASHAVHHLIYLLLFVVPIIGWLGKSAYGGDISYFGLFNFPALLAHNEPLALKILWWHKVIVKVLMACVFMHVAGALMHLVVKRDGVFRRMWPARDA